MAVTLSGQKTVTTAGTAERLSSSQVINGPLLLKALPTNTSYVYVGNVAEDVDSSNGYPLEPGEALIFEFVGNIASIWLDSAVNGEGIAWLAVNF